MELMVISTLLFASFGLLAYQFSHQRYIGQIHLPEDIKEAEVKTFGFKELLSFPTHLTKHLIEKAHIPIESVNKRLISAGRPMNIYQFFAFKILLMGFLPFIIFILFHPKPMFLAIAFFVGFIFPDYWLNGKIKKRQAEILRNLPHIIDLLNICVGAGLDFMLAVNRVIREFRPGAIIDEFKIMVQEIQMGSSRREALKNLSRRVNSPEITSFVRTLLQADRMGTPINDALRMHAEELRIHRFQKGEEMALKAPIKLLAPLLFFILPVVLIIVAGPIIIQFTRGGFVKF